MADSQTESELDPKPDEPKEKDESKPYPAPRVMNVGKRIVKF